MRQFPSHAVYRYRADFKPLSDDRQAYSAYLLINVECVYVYMSVAFISYWLLTLSISCLE